MDDSVGHLPYLSRRFLFWELAYTHARSSLYTLVPTLLVEIKFTLTIAYSLSDRTPSKRGLSMGPNPSKTEKTKEKLKKKEKPKK